MEPKEKTPHKDNMAAIKGFAARIIAKDYFATRNKLHSQGSADTDDTAEVSSPSSPDNDPLSRERLMGSNGGIEVEVHPSPPERRHTSALEHDSPVHFDKHMGREVLRSSSSADTVLSVEHSIGHPIGHGDGTIHFEDWQVEAFKNQAHHSLMRFLSVLYCLLLIVLGFSFPIAELTAERLENNYYQGYYCYLFGIGIAYLLFSYMFLVSAIPVHQEVAASFRKWKSYRKRHPEHRQAFDDLKATYDPIEATFTSAAKNSSFYLRMDAVFFGLGSMIFSGFEFGQFFEYPEDSQCRNTNAFMVPIFRFVFTLSQLYFLFINVRIRTDKFTTITRFGLMHILGTNMVIWVTSLIEETRHAVLHYSNPADHVLSGDHHGDPHGPSTYDIAYGFDHNLSSSMGLGNFSLTASPGLDLPIGLVADEIMNSCRRKSIIGQVLQAAAPILYPFIVEYSLICAALIYVMWSNVDIFVGRGLIVSKMKKLQDGARSMSYNDSLDAVDHHGSSEHAHKDHAHEDHAHNKRHQYTVDCKGSTNGMFMGILAVVAMIISMVLFFFWIKLPNYHFIAVLESYISISILYFVTTVAVVIAFWRLRDFRFDHREGSQLDDGLLITSQMGVILFNTFIIICGQQRTRSSVHAEDSEKATSDVLGMLASCLETIQSVCQTIFLLDASRRRPYKQAHFTNRPGREMITFLLACNFGMWFLDTLESWRRQLHPVQIDFFGFWPWTLVTHISMPLAIFYRFHSSVVLSEVWKKSYKAK